MRARSILVSLSVILVMTATACRTLDNCRGGSLRCPRAHKGRQRVRAKGQAHRHLHCSRLSHRRAAWLRTTGFSTEVT